MHVIICNVPILILIFFFRLVIYAMNIICNSLMLLVQVKSESDKLMLNVAVLILYLYI